jgi:endonuclease-3
VKASPIKTIVDVLEKAYGVPEAPQVTEPFEMILRENIAYLADDGKRDFAFQELKKRVGTRPADILAASPASLNEISRLAGIDPQGQLAKIVKSAEIALNNFNGDVASVMEGPINKAKASLKKFPGIGDPGAEKILMFNKKSAALALESNGLRVLTRLGYGKEGASYAATYRSVQESVGPELPSDSDWLVRAHQLLRQHGKELCKQSRPVCERCPLASDCRYYHRESTH